MQKQHITLSEPDRNYLQTQLSKGALKVRKHKRMQALLYLDEGKTYQQVAKLLSVQNITVSAWAKSYTELGLLFLEDKARSGRPIKFEGTDRAKVTALACSEAPDGHSRWSLRLLADRLVELQLVEEISYSTVGLILKK